MFALQDVILDAIVPKKFINKFRYAFAGLFDGIRHDHSIALQCLIGLFVFIACIFCT